jgi:myosin-crossreactive antigen
MKNNFDKINKLQEADTKENDLLYISETFSYSEIQELFQIKNQLNNFIEQINREPQPKTLKDKINLVNKYILILIKYLDSLSI